MDELSAERRWNRCGVLCSRTICIGTARNALSLVDTFSGLCGETVGRRFVKTERANSAPFAAYVLKAGFSIFRVCLRTQNPVLKEMWGGKCRYIG